MNQEVTFGCVLRTGGDYTKEHVYALRRNVMQFSSGLKFVCLSDVDVPGVETIKLKSNLPGKYSMVEAFRLKGAVIITGLDTIFTKHMDSFIKEALCCGKNEFKLIRAFNKNRKYANGIMIWNGDWSRLFYKYDGDYGIRNYSLEQEYTIFKLNKEKADIQVLNNSITGIHSYKHHCNKKLPNDNRVVLFHGNPRPNEATATWIKKYYNYEK